MAIIEVLDPLYLKTLLEGVKAQTDKLKFDANSYLYVNAAAVSNPPNLDVLLSSRASESTLSAFSGKFPNAAALADNLGNPTTTIVGSALLGFDGTYWRRIAADASSRMKVNAEAVANPPNLDVALSTRLSEATFTARVPVHDSIAKDIAGASRNALVAVVSPAMDISRDPAYAELSVTTTESSTAFNAPGLKYIAVINRGDNWVKVRVNSATGTQARIPPRCGKIFMFGGITAIYYVAEAGTSTLVVYGLW